jgi:hypothetical protein
VYALAQSLRKQSVLTLPSADVDFPEINLPQIALEQLLFFGSNPLRQQIGFMCDLSSPKV